MKRIYPCLYSRVTPSLLLPRYIVGHGGMGGKITVWQFSWVWSFFRINISSINDIFITRLLLPCYHRLDLWDQLLEEFYQSINQLSLYYIIHHPGGFPQDALCQSEYLHFGGVDFGGYQSLRAYPITVRRSVHGEIREYGAGCGCCTPSLRADGACLQVSRHRVSFFSSD